MASPLWQGNEIMKNDESNAKIDIRQTVEEAGGADGMVERLLHAAGPGPEIPGNGTARVKDLIRPVWRNDVASRARQRNRLWIGGLASVAALIIAIFSLQSLRPGAPVEAPQTMVVAVVDGTLEVTPPGSNVRFLTNENRGIEIQRGSFVRTGSGSRAALWLTDHRSIRLDVNTELRLDSEASVSLDSGAVYIDAQNGSETGIEVRTAFGTATDIGTQFEVRVGDLVLDLRVRQGLVALARGREEYQITEGVSVFIDTDGEVSTSTIALYDPVWSWTQKIAPPFDIEGQSVMAFLDWVSSETGLSVRFENTEVERLAASTVLHGSIEGLTPAGAPAVVLPSAQLTAAEEPGAILVMPLRSSGGGP
jgi:hypothetical protein